ncbi:MAG: pyruvate:ferredoxin (flavodoxin) oxidoreductase, partial [Peptostreptococcaceae bacterium]|nr:pyruvate:ferredoxin (flavodoxin) oxidoreductase [Peptostreptococcaceae bacterium]
ETYENLEESAGAAKTLVEAINKAEFTGEEKKIADVILMKKKHLSKKTMWMVGGDGWAYDIGYGGLDHVFAMGEDVNVLVLDTEVYSNTGGQSSKATPVGAVAQFQAAGKKTRKKDLGLLMMSYDNVYVAQCAMGANPNQLLTALKEAEEHKGPSIVIAYAPCITHGIKAGMNNAQTEMKNAVEAGYWNLYRYNPVTNVFSLDSKEPVKDFKKFLRGEVRYSSLEITFPENAEKLFAVAEKNAKEKREYYKKLSNEVSE